MAFTESELKTWALFMQKFRERLGAIQHSHRQMKDIVGPVSIQESVQGDPPETVVTVTQQRRGSHERERAPGNADDDMRGELTLAIAETRALLDALTAGA